MRYDDDVIGMDEEEDERRFFWNSVIFYFVDVPILPSAINALVG
jgi:hypothetical protein